MGQYYKPMSLDKKEWIYSHAYDNGLKLMEHSYLGNNFVALVEELLKPQGAWNKTRIVWAGDYADDEPETDWLNKGEEYPDKNLYSIIGTSEHEIKPLEVERDKEYKYLCNHTKKEFVNYDKVDGLSDKWNTTIHPLPLLTCEGNGRGGGDFHKEDERIGMWARDVLSLEKELPEGMIEVYGTFFED